MKNKKKSGTTPILVWFCITIFYCYQSILRSLPNIICQEVMLDFNIGATKFGLFTGIYYIGYIALHIPIGVAIDRLGSRRVLPICVILTATGIIPLIYPMRWASALIGRLITGIGSSAAAVGALQVLRILYPAKFSRMLGLMVSVGLTLTVCFGNIILPVILYIGIKKTLNILLYFGLVLSVFTYFIIPRSTKEILNRRVLGNIRSVLFNHKLLFTSLFAGLMVGPMEGFADGWGSAFLMNVYKLDKIFADSLMLSILLGMGTGCSVLPYIAEKTGFHFIVTIVSGIVLFVSFCYILSGLANVNTLNYVFIMIGVFSAYQVVILTKITTFVLEEQTGIAGSVANMLIMSFGWFFHNSIGSKLDSMWDGSISKGIRQYSADSFIESIAIIPTAIIIAIIGFLTIAVLSFARDKKI